MTCLKVKRDLFMSILSFASLPYVLVSPILYEPARSTKSIRLCRIEFPSKAYTLILRIE